VERQLRPVGAVEPRRIRCLDEAALRDVSIIEGRSRSCREHEVIPSGEAAAESLASVFAKEHCQFGQQHHVATRLLDVVVGIAGGIGLLAALLLALGLLEKRPQTRRYSASKKQKSA
jgi:hypothetical protein